MLALAFTGCNDASEDIEEAVKGAQGGGKDGGGADTVAVKFMSLTQQGGGTEDGTGYPTTALSLAFDKAIDGLVAGDITLTDTGETGAVKGDLTGEGPTYTLAVSGITQEGEVTVRVAKKKGYTITPSSRQVTVLYGDGEATEVGFTLEADGDEGTATTALTLAFDPGIPGLVEDDIAFAPGETGAQAGEQLTDTSDGAGQSYTLALSGITKTANVSVTVNKTGYTFPGGGSKSVKVYGNINIDVSRTDIPAGLGWSYGEGIFTIADGAHVIVTGTTDANRVVVGSGASATVRLSGVTIDVSGVPDAPAFDMSGATVELVLAEDSTNTLKSNGNAAGLQVPDGSTLTITSAAGEGSESGTLLAWGGQNQTGARGAGIGGGRATGAGSISILGGTIEARGGYDSNGSGAGIGGGGAQQSSSQQGGSGGTINISGGRVSAFNSTDTDNGQVNGGAAIGGGGGHNEQAGTGGSGGSITISGGVVNATAKDGGAGIGGGSGGKGGNIAISSGEVTASSARSGAGIGGGFGGNGGNIDISGGEVTASSAAYGAGIGGGRSGNGGDIDISGGEVTASAAYEGAGIGGGRSGNGGDIDISGGEVTASAAYEGAGIGNGSGGNGGDITISDGFVTASVPGGSGDPGAIGGGRQAGAGTIKIKGGVVVAKAGTGGAISGGNDKTDGSITISGGTVIGTGLGIGKGKATNGTVSISTTINGTAVIFATAVNGKVSNPGNGIAIGNDVGINANTKTITLKANFTIPQGATLTVPPGWILDCNSKTLTETGTLVNQGTIKNRG